MNRENSEYGIGKDWWMGAFEKNEEGMS